MQRVRSGSLKRVDIIAFKYASYMSSPKHATSPVEDISTPSVGSAPCSRVNENCGTLHAT